MRSRRVFAPFLAPLLGGWVLVACDSPGGRGGGQAIVPVDSGGDTGASDAPLFETTDADPGELGADATPPLDTVVADTTPPPDTVVADTTPPPDTTIDDTTPPDVGPTCDACVEVAGAPLGVLITQYTDQSAPALLGGAAPTGEWVLDSIDFFTADTFASGIEVWFEDNGQTSGRARFDADSLALALDLDMAVTVSAFGSTGSDSARTLLTLGGCFDVAGRQLVGAFAACGDIAPGEGSFDFELGASHLLFGVELSREALIALFPADQQEAADFAVAGPMYLVAGFVR